MCKRPTSGVIDVGVLQMIGAPAARPGSLGRGFSAVGSMSFLKCRSITRKSVRQQYDWIVIGLANLIIIRRILSRAET